MFFEQYVSIGAASMTRNIPLYVNSNHTYNQSLHITIKSKPNLYSLGLAFMLKAEKSIVIDFFEALNRFNTDKSKQCMYGYKPSLPNDKWVILYCLYLCRCNSVSQSRENAADK